MNEPPDVEVEIPSSGAAPRRAAVTFVLITVALDMLAIGIIAPVLPTLVLQFLSGDTARSAEIYGLFGTVWALMQFVCAPILGSLSDRFGRRPVILLSNLGLGLDYILMAMAPTLSWLFVGRVISGITAASVPTAGAYIADVTPPEKRAGAFGLMGAAFGFGFVFGPAIGGLLGNVDPRLPFWAAAGFSLLNAAYGYLVLPESLARDRRTDFSWRRANPLGSLKLLRSHRELFGLATINFLGYIAHESLPSMFVIYAGYRYGWSSGHGGTFAGGGGRLLGAGLRRPDPAAGGAFWGASVDVGRIDLRIGGIWRLRHGRHGRGLRAWDSVDFAVGPGGSDGAEPDVASGQRGGAGSAPGRQQQPARHFRADRAVPVHADLCLFHQ